MTVVLSYHRIVEREPAEVDSRWKSYTAILLLVIVASCLVLSFSLHGLLVDFKYNCLLDANLKFNLKANQTFGDGSNNPTISPFPDYTIDEYWSSWSDGAYCETLKYVPLLQE
ncbi:uncharacterized protein LOC126570791 isoform X2 [Anopheles aquasalis]|uniref:uncharacterized protein LOC126570791 isoform X2 n=1 Tax=Anopheles aquasalis TaxID=42839 RepID=UPI00215B11DA|nr:uncharacterized protein LOC126570791 isoform X2 [Anopheles aquasalis]